MAAMFEKLFNVGGKVTKDSEVSGFITDMELMEARDHLDGIFDHSQKSGSPFPLSMMHEGMDLSLTDVIEDEIVMLMEADLPKLTGMSVDELLDLEVSVYESYLRAADRQRAAIAKKLAEINNNLDNKGNK